MPGPNWRRPAHSVSPSSTRPNCCAAQAKSCKLASVMSASMSAGNGLAIGRSGLRQLRASLLTHSPDQAITVLQEAGYASGGDVYQAFSTWLPGRHGVHSPQDLDADLLSDALSEFFSNQGWGTVVVQPVGGAAFAVDSSDWAEADPGTAEAPMCFFTAGVLAGFLRRPAAATGSGPGVGGPAPPHRPCRVLSAMP